MASTSDDRTICALMDQVIRAQMNWHRLLALGAIQIMAGLLAIGCAFSPKCSSVTALAVWLLIAAGAQITAMLLARDWNGFFMIVLLGALYPAVGVLISRATLPATSALVLTLAILYQVGGLFRIVIASVEAFPSWGWARMNGIITILLGLAIWVQFPGFRLSVPGLLIGLDLLVNGVIWSVLAIVVHSLARFYLRRRNWMVGRSKCNPNPQRANHGEDRTYMGYRLRRHGSGRPSSRQDHRTRAG